MSDSLHNQPVVSLRSGSQIGTAAEPVISPHNFKVLGWWCKTPGPAGQVILLVEDVRDIMPRGLVVNDEAAFSPPDELVRHREILDVRFQLIGKPVKTKARKLGKVSDYSYDEAGLIVQKLHVSRPLSKVFSGDDTLIIDRSQIIEVTDRYILVEEAEIKATDEETVPAAAVASSG